MSFQTDHDPFDEFEFKPLTEGLGFHKNKAEEKIVFKTPLPRPTQNTTETPILKSRIQVPMIEDDSIAKAQTAVNEILKNLNHKKQQEETHLKNKKKHVWTPGTPSLFAGFLDGMLVLAGFLLMLIAMLTITGADLLSNLSNPGENKVIWIATMGLFISMHFIYMVSCRAYLGYTPGEWAFDQRCGSEIQLASKSYIPRVFLRTLLVTITGYLPMTLISLFTQMDIAGALSGAALQKQKMI